jgi:hypothetical protein
MKSLALPTVLPEEIGLSCTRLDRLTQVMRTTFGVDPAVLPDAVSRHGIRGVRGLTAHHVRVDGV